MLLRLGLASLVLSVRTQLQPCPQRPGWFRCGTEGARCVAVSELCDGRQDCEEGQDEAPSLCSSLSCSHGVRCEGRDTCLYTPHHQLCSAGQPACSDGSDQAYCEGRQYTGCLTATSLGLRISHCSQCYCSLLDRSAQSLQTPAVFRSSGSSWRSSNVTATICINTASKLMCNGVVDCLEGEDEDEEVCRDLQGRRGSQRRGKHLSLGRTSHHLQGDQGLEGVTVAATSVLAVLGVVGLSALFVVFYRRKLRQGSSSSDFIQLEYRDSGASESRDLSDERRFPDYWSLENNKIIQQIGLGHFSRVYLGRNLKSSELVALKILNDRNDNDLRREAEILEKLRTHPNICQILGFNIEENTLALEYCVHGNLKDHVSKLVKTSATLSPFPKWCYEIAEAMHFVDKMGVIHRDLALRNVLLTGSNVIKLSDFGLSVLKDDSDSLVIPNQEDQAVPYKWMALESLIEDKYSSKSDVWSFGVLVWELYTFGQDPYQDDNLDDLRLRLLEGERLEPLELASDQVNNLLKECWKENPWERPDFSDISQIFNSVIDSEQNSYVLMKPTI